MNFDELKTAWQILDKKVTATKTLNDKLISSVITDRSSSRFQIVRRNYVIGFSWLTLCLMAGFAVIFGNPFDYEYKIQYVPMLIYCVGLIAIGGWMIQSYIQLGRIKLDQENIRAALSAIVAVYERPKKFMSYMLWGFLLSQVILFPLSFLPRSIERIGLWPALGERLIPISIALLMVFIAYKMGAFRERDGEKFKADLNELEQLRKIAAELENA